jgi:hypothetical protein
MLDPLTRCVLLKKLGFCVKKRCPDRYSMMRYDMSAPVYTPSNPKVGPAARLSAPFSVAARGSAANFSIPCSFPTAPPRLPCCARPPRPLVCLPHHTPCPAPLVFLYRCTATFLSLSSVIFPPYFLSPCIYQKKIFFTLMYYYEIVSNEKKRIIPILYLFYLYHLV